MTLGADDVSRETLDRLEDYADLVRKWSPKINLISRADLPHLWGRHIQDSLQLLRFSGSGGRWVDLGSGGGFPGIVIAIARPDLDMHLIESDTRKATFLRTCVRELGLKAQIHANRIEDVASLGADIISARALAPLDRLLNMVSHHLAHNGFALLPKGEKATEELAIARETWSFSATMHPSETRQGATILQIEAISRA